jgi:hypothetical protein
VTGEKWRAVHAAMAARERAEWEIERDELARVRRAEREAEAAKEAAMREAAMAIIKRGEEEDSGDATN